MPKKDPRKGKIFKVHWNDAFAKNSERIVDALGDSSFAKQLTIGYISRRTKTVLQVMTTVEEDVPLEDAQCDYLNIPAGWVTKIEAVE